MFKYIVFNQSILEINLKCFYFSSDVTFVTVYYKLSLFNN
jgi:hypothetical protein